MFDQFKEAVLRVAREEEERRANQTSGGKKKKKKAKFQHLVLNEERTVLYDFAASSEYPEQLSVKAGDVVFVFESFEDGWSQVKKYSGTQGVVPTNFLSQQSTLAATSDGAAKDTISTRIKQRLKVLGLMAIEQAKVKAIQGAQLFLDTARFFATGVIVPTTKRAFLIISRNESYTTTLSSLTRNLYEITASSLVQSLTDEELAWYSAELKEDSQRIKTEKENRRAAAAKSE